MEIAGARDSGDSVSAPDNPITEQLPPEPEPPFVPTPDVSREPAFVENPPWSGWEVVALAAITLVTMVLCILVVAYALRSYLAPHAEWSSVITMPEVIVGGQLLAYVLLFFLMYGLVRNHTDRGVLEALRWKWPNSPGNYLLAGFVLEVCLLPFAYLLPMPKNLPLDEFFKTARDAYILSVFGIFFAPLFEELFFRGFLYPVLARRWGMGTSIVVTALFFASIHATQLKYSWGPVLVIFIVGLALTTVRAVKKSVAATVLMHMAYNGTIFIVTFIATDGFRHMEKFNQ
jgi:membrane protease YdiL (CAAX protease family)